MMTKNENVTGKESLQILGNLISLVFGLAFLAAGLVNMFWGNDFWFGVFIVLLSFLFFPPVTTLVRNLTGFSIPLVVKILIGVFIIWSVLGVGELFDKIDMMRNDLWS